MDLQKKCTMYTVHNKDVHDGNVDGGDDDDEMTGGEVRVCELVQELYLVTMMINDHDLDDNEDQDDDDNDYNDKDEDCNVMMMMIARQRENFEEGQFEWICTKLGNTAEFDSESGRVQIAQISNLSKSTTEQ